MVATLAISSCSVTSRADLSSSSETATAAASTPRLRSIGFAPAATERSPRWTIACASTVAVVVPSPATSFVLVATSLASWAPRFSYGFSSSISRATVTPSLVIVGAPHFLSMTTFRPLGPSVTLTVSASLSTPRSSARRASSSKSRLLAMQHLGCCVLDDSFTAVFKRPCSYNGRVMPTPRVGRSPREALPRPPADPGRSTTCSRGPAAERPARSDARLLLDNCEHVTSGEHQVLVARVLHFGAAVLAVEHNIANFDVHGPALSASVAEPAWSAG